MRSMAIRWMAGFAALLPLATHAATSNAEEAHTLFMKVCVASGGTLSGMQEKLKPFEQQKVAEHLPVEQAALLVSPKEKDNTWQFTSPATKQKLIFTHSTDRVCGMRIGQADQKQVLKNVAFLVNLTTEPPFNGVVQNYPDKPMGDKVLHYTEVKTTKGTMGFGLLTRETPVSTGPQHMLTYHIDVSNKKQ